MSVAKVVELVGSSKKSWEDAVQQMVREASQSLRHIKAVDVVLPTRSGIDASRDRRIIR